MEKEQQGYKTCLLLSDTRTICARLFIFVRIVLVFFDIISLLTLYFVHSIHCMTNIRNLTFSFTLTRKKREKETETESKSAKCVENKCTHVCERMYVCH